MKKKKEARKERTKRRKEENGLFGMPVHEVVHEPITGNVTRSAEMSLEEVFKDLEKDGKLGGIDLDKEGSQYAELNIEIEKYGRISNCTVFLKKGIRQKPAYYLELQEGERGFRLLERRLDESGEKAKVKTFDIVYYNGVKMQKGRNEREREIRRAFREAESAFFDIVVRTARAILDKYGDGRWLPLVLQDYLTQERTEHENAQYGLDILKIEVGLSVDEKTKKAG